ncbi:hypothetical protein A5868_002131, partial [Enterococcus sp. 12F9_DIV0723]
EDREYESFRLYFFCINFILFYFFLLPKIDADINYTYYLFIDYSSFCKKTND